MLRTAAGRLAALALQLLALSLCMFFLASLMPGDALTGQIDPNASPVEMERMRQAHGFYDPWYQRYGQWLAGVLRGDFGQSYTYRMPVSRLVAEKAGNTFALGGLSALLCFGVGIPLGLLSGRRWGRPADKLITGGSYAALSLPLVALGVIAILLFSYVIPLFPSGGSVSPQAAAAGGWRAFFSRLHHLILPAAVGALLYMPPVVQLLRQEVIRLENAPFTIALRSRGISESALYRRHILRNALVPTASMLGTVVAQVLSGMVFVEAIFAFPGLGSLFLESVLRRDFAVANCLILLFSALAGLGFWLTDILLPRIDPRLRRTD